MIRVTSPSTVAIDADIIIDRFQPQSDTWVKLRDRPTPYSDDEALLLCETVEGLWLAWVSGFGQMTLQPGEFYRLT
jgi:hypothetical protein